VALGLLVAAGLGSIAYGLSLTTPAPAGDPWTGPPDIVVITLCSVRADHLGAYGYATAATPRLDALAKDGVLFENAWSNATFTLPAHAALLTGLTPAHAGVTDATDTLATGIPSVPEVLRAYGYHTVAYAPVASQASFRAGEGLERGFDTFVEGHSIATDPAVLDQLEGGRFFALIHFKDAHPPYGIGGPDSPKVDPRITEWNTRRGGQPGVVPTEDPDGWFVKQLLADPALRAEVTGLYDRALTRADAQVGAMLDGLAARHLLAHTVVIVAGDHGQALGDDGRIGHQGYLIPSVLHVPLIVHLPDGTPRRVADDVSLVDLAPTLLALAGATLPAVQDGHSLLPLLHGEPAPARPALAQALSKTTAGPRGEEVLVESPYWLAYSLVPVGWRLLKHDADAWTDVSTTEPERAQAMLADRARLSGDSRYSTAPAPVPADQRAALQKEGYW
jgi:arylsulfatase A-like enzyme